MQEQKQMQIDENQIFEIDPLTIVIKDDRPRQRKEMGAIKKMAESIQTFGQLLPIIIDRENGLVAGGRRLAACILLGRKARVCYKDSVDPVLLREIELEENIQRKPLTPAEESLAIAELVELKQGRLGKPTSGRKGGFTLDDAAEMLGKTRGTVIENIQIAEAVRAFPNLGACKTKSEIKKAVKGLERVQRNVAAIQQYEETIKKNDTVIIVNRSAEEYLQGSPDNSIDLFFTDPPYGIDINNIGMTLGGATGGETTTAGTKYEDTWEYAQSLLNVLVQESFRTTKDNGHAYFFCGRDRFIFQWLYDSMVNAGWLVLKWPIIWIKRESGQNNQPEMWPSNAYEAILYARKVNSVLAIPGRPDWIQCDPVSSSQKIHQAEKPVALCKELIARACMPGAYMLDPCMGSGALVEAGVQMKLLTMGSELSPEIYADAASRLSQYLTKEEKNG